MMSRRWLSYTVVAVGCGCAAEPVACTDMLAQIAGCDLRPANLTCEDLSPVEQESLYVRLRKLGCEGVWNEAHTAVDDRACRAFAWDCPTPHPQMSEARPWTSARYPVVLVGGIDGREQFGWNEDLVARIEARTGSRVYPVALPAWTPTRNRAADLQAQLAALELQQGKFNLICYAVGGIDCRFLVSAGGLFADNPQQAVAMADQVASITTIATPHRGTAVANAALSFAEYGSTAGVLAAVLGPDGYEATGQDEDTVRETLRGLTNEQMLAFNRIVTDAPGVVYQSYAGVSVASGQPFAISQESVDRHCTSEGGANVMLGHAGTWDAMHELLWVTAPFSSRTVTEGGATLHSPIDGMVAVESAKWGDFRGCLPADHYDVIGQFDDFGPDVDTGFDAAAFLSEIIGDLAGRGL